MPGSLTTLTLEAHDNIVTGTGTWTGEACCSGVVAVSGTIENSRVTLDLTRTTTDGTKVLLGGEHFEGRVSQSALFGTLTSNGTTAAYSYERDHAVYINIFGP